MTNFTFNNHLKYSIGGREFGQRQTSSEKFVVSVGKIDHNHFKQSTYQDELLRTARLVREDFGDDLVVFLSGGSDSEIVLRNFVDNGFKPRCVSIRFMDGHNLADMKEAEEIARELGVKHEFIDFDVVDFYRSGQALEFTRGLQCTQITYLMVYYNVLKLSAPSVMGGEVLLTRHVSPEECFWHYTFRENEDASAMRFSNTYGIPLVNEWFSYTPELLLHFLQDHQVKSLVTERFNYKLTSVSSKNSILSRLYPNLRPKIKTHGFERLLAFNYEAYRELSQHQVKRLEQSIDGIRIEKAIEMLT